MKFWRTAIIFLLSFYISVPINGDTYHYRVIRKICPTGTYHDVLSDKCRRVPGGGEMIKINLDARCSGKFTGILAHSTKSRYYYVCKKDGVLTCMCKPNELFSKIRLKCEGKNCNKEKFTHQVVDNILDKYKCTMMDGSYENGKCLLPIAITEDPRTAFRSIEDENFSNISRLQNFLKYLKILKTIDSNLKSIEQSLEVTTAQPIFIDQITTKFSTEATTTQLPATIEPRSFKSIENEFEEFKELWKLNQTPKPSQSSEEIQTTENPVTEEIEDENFDGSGVSARNFGDEDEEDESFGIEQRSFDDDIIKKSKSRNVTRKIKKSKKSKFVTTTTPKEEETTTLQFVEYFEYFYEDDPDKVLWTKDINETETQRPDELISVIDFDENLRLFNEFETTTENRFDETTTDGILTTTQNESLIDTTTEFDQIPTTTLNVPAPLIQRSLDDENSLNTGNEKELKGNLSKKPFKGSDLSLFIGLIDENQETTTQNDETTTNIISTTLNDETTTLPDETTSISLDSTTTLLESTTIMPESTTIVSNDIESTTDLTTTEFSETTTTESNILTTTEFDDYFLMNFEPTTESDISTSTNEISTTTEDFASTTTEEFTSTTTDSENLLSTTTNDENLSTTTTDLISTTTENFDSDEKISTTTENIFDSLIDTLFERYMKHIGLKLNDRVSKIKIGNENESTTEIISTTTSVDESTTINSDFTTTENDEKTTTDSNIESTTTENVKTFESSTPQATTDSSTFGSKNSSEKVMSIDLNDSQESDEVSVALINTKNHKITLNPVTTPKNYLINVSSLIPTSSTIRPSNPLYWRDPEKPDIEHYYSYEEYDVDENGNPIEKSEQKNASKKDEVISKQQRDNSFEYYVESISASHETRNPEYFNYFF